MKLKFTLFFFSILFSSTIAWGQTWNLSPTMTATLDDNGTLTISTTASSEAMPDYSTENSYYQSNNPPAPWYNSRTSISSVVIGQNVTSIGYDAFLGCINITTVSIPNTVTTIAGNNIASNSYGDIISNYFGNFGAFGDCFKLTSITVVAANPAFMSENGILFNKTKTTLVCYPAGKTESSYTIPSTVTTIGAGAFKSSSDPNNYYYHFPSYSSNYHLTSVTIPNSVKTIGDCAFTWSWLTSVTIPASVTAIGNNAFWDCSDLIDVTIQTTSKIIDSGMFFNILNNNYYNNGGMMYGNPNPRSLTVPKGTLSSYMDLSSTFPIIGDGTTYFFTLTPTMTATLDDKGVLTVSTTKAGGESMPDYDPCSTDFINDSFDFGGYGNNSPFSMKGAVREKIVSIMIGNGITSIGNNAFLCDFCTSLIISNSVTSIGDGAFAYCTSLTSITIPNSVTSIGSEAFASYHSNSYSYDVTVNWATPLAVPSDIFYNIASATLHVPTGTKALYQQAAVWKDFGKIDDGTPDNTLSLSLNSLNFSALGEQKTFSITSNTNWTVGSSASWLTVSPVSGSNDSTITVTATANTTTAQRTATITVSGTGVTAQTISVTQAAAIPVTAVALNYTTESLTVGETLQLTATVSPANATNQSLRWSSSTETVAMVSDSGLITAKAAGTAVIIVTTVDGGFTASCTVTVNPPAVAVTGIKLNTASVAILVGDTLRLTATVEPANATNKSLRWSSSTETVAMVSDSGLITAKAAGTAVIIVTTVDGGFPATCNVEVQPLSVEIPDSTQTIGANGKGTINLSLTIPSNATVTGSFLIQFPDGITLDEQLTVLSAQLSGNFSLSFTAEANNTWLITIKSNGLKSAAETPTYTKIMDIAYKASGGIEKGTYTATIKNLDFITNTGVPIQKDLKPITINVNQTFTAIENISNSSFYAYIANNTLKVESPQAEKITVYSASGVLLYSAMKSAGEMDIPVSSLHGSIYIIKGSVSGTIKVTK